MTSLLDGLDDVQWVRVRETWGLTGLRSLIPGLLRRLESAGPVEAWSVYSDLEGVLIHGHSGGYFWTAEYVVPFLNRLCGSPNGHVVAVAVDLLSMIACAQPYIDEIEEGNWGMLERIQTTLLHERPLYLSLLAHPEPKVRSEAADLLSVIDSGEQRRMGALEPECLARPCRCHDR
ncbi:hypothetical protein [Kitasatospora sp. P5_F3]